MINENSMKETVSIVTKAANSIIENMPPGSRFTTKEFVGQIVSETNIPVAIATGITALAINNCDSVKQRAGRNGGIYKLGAGTSNMATKLASVASILVQNMNQDPPFVAGEEDEEEDENL